MHAGPLPATQTVMHAQEHNPQVCRACSGQQEGTLPDLVLVQLQRNLAGAQHSPKALLAQRLP